MGACDICGKEYKSANLVRHIREVHKLHDYISPTSYYNFNNKCLEGCSASFVTLKDLRFHLQHEHKFKIETEHLEFSSIVEFKTWYDDLCHTENIQYNKNKHTVSSDKGSITYYNCNRSGNKKEIQNVKRTKKKGSCKLNYACTSQIILVEKEDGFEVTYHKTHYGHSIELQHIRLPKRDRFTVAAKLECGVPINRILNDVRDNIEGNMKRTDLVTRKDLQNIKNAFGINNNKNEKYKDDTSNFELWMEKQKRSENNCVLFYKKQGEDLSEGIISLNEEDSCLIIMNKSQQSMLEKFGQGTVIINNTPRVTPCDLDLTILMVIDEYGQAFPAACMFSNRKDEYIYTCFFGLIKEKCGIIAPKVFMTDITDVYYSAWIQVMNIPSFRLYCSWLVDADWKIHLDKVGMLEKRAFVSKTLKYLEANLDEDAFTRELEKSIDIFIKDRDTREFGYYFRDNYLHNVKMWAYCYRKGSGININMNVPIMHKKSFESLNKAVDAVITFIRAKTAERIIKLTKGMNSSHIQQMLNCHRAAVTSKFNIEAVDKDEFEVHTEGERSYTVRKQKDVRMCCKVICKFCQICVHAYSCECTDFSIEMTICKHIHMVILKKCIQNNETSGEQNQLNTDKASNQNSKSKPSDIEKAKTNIYSMISFIKTEVASLQDEMDVIQINNSLKEIVSQLSIIKAKENTDVPIKVNKQPTNSLSENENVAQANKSSNQDVPQINTDKAKCKRAKKRLTKVYPNPASEIIDEQPVFQSTKRKKKTKEDTNLKKPNLEEEEDIRAILFQ